MKKLLVTVSVITLVPLIVIACHGGSDDSSSSQTPQQQIQQLEASGVIPALDRSTDLKGPDADNNGLRDDIDSYVAKQGYTAIQKMAVLQYAKALQAAVVAHTTDRPTAITLSDKVDYAINCVYAQFSNANDAYQINDLYQKLIVNTAARMNSYLGYNHALNGTVSASLTGDTCEK
ncbi:hypothetical protein [Caballeronia grimmiae]|uniref:hypothetical protein n=1 Tax=Caballeronia grimmiae TaxID=1071679 RepID=UPI0038BD162A